MTDVAIETVAVESDGSSASSDNDGIAGAVH